MLRIRPVGALRRPSAFMGRFPIRLRIDTLTETQDAVVPSAFAADKVSLTNPGTDGDLTLAWTEHPFDGGSPITDVVYRIDGGSAVSTGSAASADEFTISGLDNETEYDGIEIAAVNAVGTGAWLLLPPATPTAGATAPENTVAPVISGDTLVGSLLTLTSAGTWTGSPTPTLTRQWRVNDADATGETGTTFDTSALEAGDTVECRVTGTNSEAAVDADSNTITMTVITVTVSGHASIEDAEIDGNPVKVVTWDANGSVDNDGEVTYDVALVDGGGTGGRGASAGAGGGGSGCGPETVERNQTLEAGTHTVTVAAAAVGPTTNDTYGTDGAQSSFEGFTGGGPGLGGGGSSAGTRAGKGGGPNGSGGGALGSGANGAAGDGTVFDGSAGVGSATGSERAGGAGAGAGGNAASASVNNGAKGGPAALSTFLDNDTMNYGAGGGGPGATPGAGGDNGGGSGGTNGGAAGSAPSTPGSASGGVRAVQPANAAAGRVRIAFHDVPGVVVEAAA